MKTFIYTANRTRRTRQSSKWDVEITVYRIKRNKPEYLGKRTYDVDAHPGDRCVASEIIHEIEGEPYREGPHGIGILRCVWQGKAELIRV